MTPRIRSAYATLLLLTPLVSCSDVAGLAPEAGHTRAISLRDVSEDQSVAWRNINLVLSSSSLTVPTEFAPFIPESETARAARSNGCISFMAEFDPTTTGQMQAYVRWREADSGVSASVDFGDASDWVLHFGSNARRGKACGTGGDSEHRCFELEVISIKEAESGVCFR